jgi:hypothetical protein
MPRPPGLPTDIIFEIVNFFPSKDHYTLADPNSEFDDLHAIALTCRSWWSIAQPKLFKGLVLTFGDSLEDSPQAIQWISKAIKTIEDKGPLVRHIMWESAIEIDQEYQKAVHPQLYQRLAELSEQYDIAHGFMPESLDTSNISTLYMMDIFDCAPALARHFRWVSWDFGQLLSPARFQAWTSKGGLELVQMPDNLQELRMENIKSEERLQLMFKRMLTSGLAQSVTTLQLYNVVFPSASAQCSFIAVFQNLSRLEMDHVDTILPADWTGWGKEDEQISGFDRPPPNLSQLITRNDDDGAYITYRWLTLHPEILSLTLLEAIEYSIVQTLWKTSFATLKVLKITCQSQFVVLVTDDTDSSQLSGRNIL